MPAIRNPMRQEYMRCFEPPPEKTEVNAAKSTSKIRSKKTEESRTGRVTNSELSDRKAQEKMSCVPSVLPNIKLLHFCRLVNITCENTVEVLETKNAQKAWRHKK